jgi:hypothetical protein
MKVGNIEFKFRDNGVLQVSQHWSAQDHSPQHTYDLTKEQAQSLLIFLEGHLGAKLFFDKPQDKPKSDESESEASPKKKRLF